MAATDLIACFHMRRLFIEQTPGTAKQAIVQQSQRIPSPCAANALQHTWLPVRRRAVSFIAMRIHIRSSIADLAGPHALQPWRRHSEHANIITAARTVHLQVCCQRALDASLLWLKH